MTLSVVMVNVKTFAAVWRFSEAFTTRHFV